VRPPRPGLHGGIVGHDCDGTPKDGSDPGHHRIGGKVTRESLNQQALLCEPVGVVEQQAKPLPDEELALLGQLLLVLFRAS